MIKDSLQRFLFDNASCRGEIVHLNESFQTIMQQHSYPPVIQQVLGEVLAVAILLGATIKFNGRLTVQFQGKGKLKLILAQTDQDSQLRGLVQWTGELSQAEILAELKQGLLGIILEPETKGAQRYQGIVAWQGESLAQSIEGYFKQSEQLETRLWLAVNETSAAGLLLQVLPNEKSEAQQNEWEHLIQLTNTVTPEELLTLDNATLLYRLYSQEHLRLLTEKPVKFNCNCSVERSENAILLLGKEEAEEELHQKQKLVVKCEFCSKEYLFDRDDVARIFNKGGHSFSSSQMH